MCLTPSGVCAYASPAVRAAYGYDREALLGRSILALAHPDNVDAVRQALSHLREGKPEWQSWRVICRRADRHWVISELRATPVITYGGVVTGILCSLRALDDLARDDGIRPDGTTTPIDVVLGVAHDLRDYLATAHICATVCRGDESFTGRDRLQLDLILSAVRRGLRRLDDMQALAILEGSLPAANLVDLGRVAESAAGDLYRAPLESKPRVHIDQLPKVLGDKMMLTRAFRSSMEVVAAATRQAPALLQVSAQRFDIWWRISVTATSGSRQNRSPTVDDKWLLPLMTCRRILESHGGEFVIGARGPRETFLTFPAAA